MIFLLGVGLRSILSKVVPFISPPVFLMVQEKERSYSQVSNATSDNRLIRCSDHHSAPPTYFIINSHSTFVHAPVCVYIDVYVLFRFWRPCKCPIVESSWPCWLLLRFMGFAPVLSGLHSSPLLFIILEKFPPFEWASKLPLNLAFLKIFWW